jgi:hypothetical protein
MNHVSPANAKTSAALTASHARTPSFVATAASSATETAKRRAVNKFMRNAELPNGRRVQRCPSNVHSG